MAEAVDFCLLLIKGQSSIGICNRLPGSKSHETRLQSSEDIIDDSFLDMPLDGKWHLVSAAES
jgi:hypothetical protein